MTSIPQFFEKNAARYAQNTLMWEKKDGSYEGKTYEEIRQMVYRFSAGLIANGVKKNDKIALLAEGRTEWLVSELAVLYAGATCVPLSVKLEEGSELIFRLKHSECRMVIASGRHAGKIRKISQELPDLEQIILLDPPAEGENELAYHEIVEEGKKFLKDAPDDFENTWQRVSPEDYANISYTSGTTSDPKGILLSHRNYTANVEQAIGLMDIPQDYKTLLILPWDHSFAHTAGLYSFIEMGASIACIEVGKSQLETLKNIPKNIKEIKPNIILSVPSLAKNFRKNIERGISQKGKTIEKLYHHALNIAYQLNGDGYQRHDGFQLHKKLLLKLYDRLIFKKIRDNFGGELKFFIGGGALLDIELQKYFYAIGMPMYQGYGLSEAAPIISSNAPHKHRLGSSGFLVENLDLKIMDENGHELPEGEKGEIVIRGENVMKGYWKNEKATHETIKDGWLYTGDMGYMGKDGFLYVLGRFKSLLISSDGEKFSPEGIEESLTEHSPYIDQIMLHNNQDPYTIALIYPNIEAIKKLLADKGLEASDQQTAEAVVNVLQEEINRYRKDGEFEGEFPERWMPATFGLLEEGFTQENKLMNSTIKIVRGRINERYKDLIKYLYSPEGKNVINTRNLEVAGKLLGHE
ncbi:MAG: AMP-binding protein [Bacteroidales bacterium]|nr:AMP-binding protein [Bacteroidales bacterium]